MMGEERIYTHSIPYSIPTSIKIRSAFARRLYKESLLKDQSIIVVIQGPTGAGKSTLALRLAYSFVGDWDYVLNELIIFTPFELEEKSKKARREGIKYPLLIWDDAGPWMRLVKNFPWDPLAVSILGHFETMRTWCGPLILTMTTDKHLPRAIYENGNLYKYKVNTYKEYYDEKRGIWKAVAYIYERKEKANREGFYWDTNNVYRIKFWHFKPGDPVYEKYLKMRVAYSEIFDEVMEKAKTKSRAAVALTTAHERWKEVRKRILGDEEA
ncbi:hypothetical protein J4526_01465 [Desulfurococcaceae archaeon MEX13E-LK6-19]|nr:hypothetical protein J4526_01465 [Desulfurococcaceae archaeon MEX13E-LK6-19]